MFNGPVWEGSGAAFVWLSVVCDDGRVSQNCSNCVQQYCVIWFNVYESLIWFHNRQIITGQTTSEKFIQQIYDCGAFNFVLHVVFLHRYSLAKSVTRTLTDRVCGSERIGRMEMSLQKQKPDWRAKWCVCVGDAV